MAGSVGDPIAVRYVGGGRDDEQTQRAIDALESDATVNTVTAVSTTADAVSRALKPVDCVVIEYDARGIDGPTVLEKIDDCPTIAIFDDGDGSREMDALASGADRTLRSPADSMQWPAVLVDRVEDAVEQRRLVDGSDDAERRYRSLFENNPHIIWEEDYSASKRRLDDIVARADDLEAYFDANPEVVRELMADVEIIDVNRNAVDYYDAPSKAALLDNLDKVFTETAYEAVKGMWLAIANGETTYRWETVGQTLSGERKHEIIELNVPDAYADDLSRVYVTAMDITDRKRRQRELQRQRDRLEEFASVVSHDLRNPLSVAEGHLELASDEYDSDQLRKVGTAHDRMRTLIDDLLALARDGQRVDDPEPVALREIAASCWEAVATAMPHSPSRHSGLSTPTRPSSRNCSRISSGTLSNTRAMLSRSESVTSMRTDPTGSTLLTTARASHRRSANPSPRPGTRQRRTATASASLSSGRSSTRTAGT
jgi:signal transduction histidine kinase